MNYLKSKNKCIAITKMFFKEDKKKVFIFLLAVFCLFIQYYACLIIYLSENDSIFCGDLYRYIDPSPSGIFKDGVNSEFKLKWNTTTYQGSVNNMKDVYDKYYQREINLILFISREHQRPEFNPDNQTI